MSVGNDRLVGSAGAGQRYGRQMLLPEVGAAGQAAIAQTRLLCIGAGGLGCAALPYLAGAGFGRISIVDGDVVDLGNLHRQTLYGEADIGHAKAAVAATRLRGINSDIDIAALETRLCAGNVAELVRDHDIVLDGSDNFATKYLLADACVKFGRPLVYASATASEAMVTTFDARVGPCLRCLYPEAPQGWVPNCSEAGVLGPLVGVAGSIQAMEAIKLAVGGDELRNLVGRLLVIDARDMQVRQLQMRRREDCQVCAGPREAIVLADGDDAGVGVGVGEIGAEAAQQLCGACFIDVREADEFAAGHVPGAQHLPLSALRREGMRRALPEATGYVIYCAHGPRSREAARLLREAIPSGAVLHILRGGLSLWPGTLQRQQASSAER